MPARPRDFQDLDPLAAAILEELRKSPAAREIILGGYFALRQHLDYRNTHDLDAWWRTGRSEEAMVAIRRAVGLVAGRRRLEFRERAWGETVSFELLREGKAIFSFQIALRTVELEPPQESRWPPILVESLRDNIGSKMNALVQRGAARDFLDVREAAMRGIVTVQDCWELWTRKNPGADPDAARANVLRHLEALEQRRPLEDIADPGERTAARDARRWIRQTLLQLGKATEE